MAGVPAVRAGRRRQDHLACAPWSPPRTAPAAGCWLVAPTGKAVDVAIREGAGDTGYTIAKALQSLRDDTLKLTHLDLVVVDEAGMVGTDDLRQLLTATTDGRGEDRAGR